MTCTRGRLIFCLLLTGCGGPTNGAGDAGPGIDAHRIEDTGSGAHDVGPGVDSGVGTDAAFSVDVGPGTDTGQRGDAGSACANIDALDDLCTTDLDCAFAIHAADCCGTLAAIGFSASEADRYAALEPVCDASYPPCGCAARPTLTDSGEMVDSAAVVHVACVTRGPRAVCLTYVSMRPPMGR